MSALETNVMEASDQTEVSCCMPLRPFMQVDERCGAVQDLEARLTQSQEMADLFTNRERIFDLPPSPFPALTGTPLCQQITSTCLLARCTCMHYLDQLNLQALLLLPAVMCIDQLVPDNSVC